MAAGSATTVGHGYPRLERRSDGLHRGLVSGVQLVVQRGVGRIGCGVERHRVQIDRVEIVGVAVLALATRTFGSSGGWWVVQIVILEELLEGWVVEGQKWFWWMVEIAHA